MSEFKVASTNEVKAIVALSMKRGYNRILNPLDVQRLDYSGVSLLSVMMIHEHAGGFKVDPHYRCKGLLKMRGSKEPFECTIDVDINQYDRLKSVSKAIIGSETK